eukprot:3881700-Pyramimonas_sp.AAC.1
MRTHGQDAGALEGHVEALRAGHCQRNWPTKGQRGKDARVPLGRMPSLVMRVGCIRIPGV